MFTEVKGIHLSAVVLVHRILLFLHHFTYPEFLVDLESFITFANRNDRQANDASST